MILGTVNSGSAPNMSPMAELVGATDPENFLFAYVVLYIILNVITIVVFNLGFARKLPVLKLAVVYILMLFGNIFMTFLALSLPIIESLFVAALILGVYKIQLKRYKKEEDSTTD
ncbi:YlaH-like family protein [Evansella clarkii]|jgi:hypothetical protein|uniref:YlaH-like family protein n=1 Tax=Evansella clarkii TaxID=79879 RepID=UPI000997C923|nr:YlaH-like family protein [Evansella clarkii]